LTVKKNSLHTHNTEKKMLNWNNVAHEPVDVTTSLAGQGADGQTRAKTVCTLCSLYIK